MARPVEKRDHIERGVLEVVARKGLHGTTIQDIADAANVSPGLLYRYWKNRDDLAADVYRKHYVKLVQDFAGIAATTTNPAEQLQRLIHAFLTFADEQPELLRFLLLSQHDLARCVPEPQGVRALGRRIIDHGIQTGLFRNIDPDLALQMLIGIVVQPAVGVIYGHLTAPVSNHADDVFHAVQRALFNHNSAPET